MAVELYNITSANATGTLVVEDLFPQGIKLEGFSTDQAITQGQIVVGEARMGVDGNMAAGFVNATKVVTLMFEAASPTQEMLSDIFMSMSKNKTIYPCTLTFDIPSIGKTYTWSAGIMTTGQPVPDVKKLLEPTTWIFTFGDLTDA